MGINTDEALLVTKTAAQFLNVQPRTLEKWRFLGGGPKFIKYSSRCVRYKLSDLKAWVEKHSRISTSDLGDLK